MPQMVMGGFKANMQANMSQSLYGAAMTNRAPKVKAAPKRTSEVKMAVANNSQFYYYPKWGSLDESKFARSSDV